MSVKKYHVFEKDYVWNPAKMENGKYLASIMGDSAIIYHKVIDEDARCDEIRRTMTKQKLFQKILMKRKYPVKCKIFIFYLHFYLFISISVSTFIW